MHDELIVSEFSRQADSFNRAPVMSSAETLGLLAELVPADGEAAHSRWLDTACGTGIVSRALALRVAKVVGVDLTPEMLDVARRETAAAGLTDVRFDTGDAASLPLADASFDGAVTRFSLHHIPLPGRVVAEMARVVKPGGWIILADHVTDEETDAAAWHQEIERLRDPSHWSCLTPAGIHTLAQGAGLELDLEHLGPFTLDFEEWLVRGTGGARNAGLIATSLATRPPGTPSFRVDGDGRRLQLRYSLTRWRKPDSP
jgi:SAM-dependent methyltransferase